MTRISTKCFICIGIRACSEVKAILSMFYLFLTDVTVSPLLLPLEQNLDPLSLTHADVVGSYLPAGWISPLTIWETCLLKILVQ